MVTDVSLQVQGEAPSGFPRTLPVRVTPACVLGPDVLGELATAAPHRFFFRDALRDQGMCPPHSREPRGRSDPTPGLWGFRVCVLGHHPALRRQARGLQRPLGPPRLSLSPLHYGHPCQRCPWPLWDCLWAASFTGAKATLSHCLRQRF